MTVKQNGNKKNILCRQFVDHTVKQYLQTNESDQEDKCRQSVWQATPLGFCHNLITILQNFKRQLNLVTKEWIGLMFESYCQIFLKLCCKTPYNHSRLDQRRGKAKIDTTYNDVWCQQMCHGNVNILSHSMRIHWGESAQCFDRQSSPGSGSILKKTENRKLTK